MSINKGQIKAIHTLLSQLGMSNDKEFKQDLVKQFTSDRETSTTKMEYKEAQELIGRLKELVGQTPEQIRSDAMRKKIIHMARRMRWELPNGDADIARIDNWCRHYGYLHKGINQYAYEELPELVTQFESVFKSYLKTRRNDKSIQG